MKNKIILFLVCILTVSVFPTFAKANTAVYTYTYGPGLSETIVTADGTIFLEDSDAYEYSYDTNFSYEIVKLKNNNVVKKLSLAKGLNYLAEYNGAVYSVFLNSETGEVSIYDDHLELRKTIALDVKGDQVEVAQYENYVSFKGTAQEYEPTVGWKKVETFGIVDLTKYAKVTASIDVPLQYAKSEIKSFDGNGISYLTIYDALGQEKHAISLFELSYNIEYQPYLAGDKVVFIGSTYSSPVGEKLMITLNLNGKVLNEQVIPIRGGGTHQQVGDNIRLEYTSYIDDNYDNYVTTFIDYNLKSGKFDMSSVKQLPKEISNRVLTETYYLEQDIQYYPMALVKTFDGKTVYDQKNQSVYWIEDEHYMLIENHNASDDSNKNAYIINLKNGNAVASEISTNTKILHTDDKYVFYSTNSYDEQTRQWTTTAYVADAEGVALLVGDVVATNKVWTITFSQPVDPQTVANIYVVDAQGQTVATTFNIKNNQIEILPPAVGYAKGQNYVLHISDTVQSAAGQVLTKGTTKEFTIQ